LEVLLILGFVGFLVYRWLDSDEPNKKSYIPSKPYEPGMVKREAAPPIINNDFQSIINSAIHAERSINITYKDLENRVTTRTITPKQLFLTDGSGELALTAFCHLRKEKRTFIVNRIINFNGY
jgi:hypothetical protein